MVVQNSGAPSKGGKSEEFSYIEGMNEGKKENGQDCFGTSERRMQGSEPDSLR